MSDPLRSDPVRRRKLLGAWYTPEALVEHVVTIALADLPLDDGCPISVLDPACGDGRFLSACGERLGGRARLTGVDIDPVAVAMSRQRLPDAEILQADALEQHWGDRRFDVVIGNPPFLNQMSSATTRGGRSRFGGGPYADAAAEFLAMAVQLARGDGGSVALVLPQSVLSTRDATPIRAGVLERAALVHLWWSHEPMFEATVRTCAVAVRCGVAQGEVTRTTGPRFEAVSAAPAAVLGPRSWGALLLDEVDLPPDASGRRLGEVASFVVDFRDQYYGLVGAVGDDVEGPPLITSGLIDPGRCLWGEREMRFAKRRYLAPRVDLDLLSPRMLGWARRRLVPKLLIANQTRAIEVVADPAGAWLPSVPVITCTTAVPDEVARILGGADAIRWVRHHAAGSGLSANTVRLTPALLASIPLG
jgi:hypothetical protein